MSDTTPTGHTDWREKVGRDNFDHGIMAAQIERMYRHAFDRRLPIPEDLFRLAMKDPLIRSHIDMWRNGHCSWEAALIGIIVHRQAQYDKLMENAMIALDMSVKPFYINQSDVTKAFRDKIGEGRGEVEAQATIKQMGLTVLARHGRTFVVAPKPGLLCTRYYDYIIVTVEHEKLAELIVEGKTPINGGARGPDPRQAADTH